MKRETVQGAIEPDIPLVAADGFSWPTAENEQIRTMVELDQPLTAPIPAGTRVGQAVFTLNGKEIGRVDLLCGVTAVPRVESALHTLKLPS